MKKPKAPDREVFSLDALRAYLHLGNDTTKKLLETGQIKAQKLPNGRWLIHKSAAIEWLTRGNNGGESL
jgi:hypothetical protein